MKKYLFSNGFILLTILLLSLHRFKSPINPAGVQRYDIIIDEIMADPSPQVSLPNAEWIELKNISPAPVSLAGWKVGDATSLSGPLPTFNLKPDSVVIVCSANAVGALSAYGPTIALTSFPSLDNTGDQLYLKDANGKTIHSVAYNSSWYQNELKKDGGWSLEMIDTHSPCAGNSNWKASINNAGGTPGTKNSADAVNTDELPPRLMRSYALDSLTIVLVFDEPLDSVQAATTANYSIDGGITVNNAMTVPPLFDEVQLKLSTSIQSNQVYTITANNIADCKNNSIGSFNHAKTGLPSEALKDDIVVNEILFDPATGGHDYVELYNKSNKTFDLSKLYIANRNSSNVISSITALTRSAWLMLPGDYFILTEDADDLSTRFLVKHPEFVLTLSALPSFPDDKGYVIVLNSQGQIVDEVDYRDDWHFKLISNAEAVALERIDPTGPSQDAGNWHSAASTVGYGTPTYKNSQFKHPKDINATIELLPKIFSPDNDGQDDFATIQYKTDQPGYVANITIFDAAGRPVKSFVRNALLAAAGYWTWDGLDDKNKKLPVGVYIVFTELFTLDGNTRRFKNTIVLARKLN